MTSLAYKINAIKGIRGAQPFQVRPSRAADPTKTLTLRNAWIRDINNRFNALKRVMRISITDNDCFGLKDRPHTIPELIAQGSYQTELDKLSPLKPSAFKFTRNDQKVKGFMTWLKEQEKLGILELTATSGRTAKGIEAWSNIYIQSAYTKGLSQARADLIQAGVDVPNIAEIPGGISGVFHQPFHADAVGLIYSRVYSELEGVTAAMDQAISRHLAHGLAAGQGPYTIARDLVKDVDNIGINRARTIARTEVTQTYNTAAINEYTSAERLLKEPIHVQWWTAGDDRVRAHHIERHAQIYTKEEAYELIGEPNCRCALLPWIKSLSKPGKTPRRISEPSMRTSAEPPMAVIGEKVGCLLPGVTGNALITLATPKGCSDYVRSPKGSWTLKGRPVSASEAKRLDGLRLPPGWDNVIVARDASAKVQAIGLDKVGRWQYRYSAEHIAKAAQRKFDRVKLFSRDMSSIRRGIDEGVKAGDPRAMLMRIEDKTVIRNGSAADYRAKVKAYGLTTLQNEHLTIKGNKIYFDFIAKKGVRAQYTITDDVLAPWLRQRKAATKVGEKLFPDVPASKLNSYLSELAGGKKYTVKDFRTYHATRIAREELKKIKNPFNLTKKQMDKIVKDVSTKVSSFLHNTPLMAKSSYIDPMVWDMIGLKDVSFALKKNPFRVKKAVKRKPKAAPKPKAKATPKAKPTKKVSKTDPTHWVDAKTIKEANLQFWDRWKRANFHGFTTDKEKLKAMNAWGRMLAEEVRNNPALRRHIKGDNVHSFDLYKNKSIPLNKAMKKKKLPTDLDGLYWEDSSSGLRMKSIHVANAGDDLTRMATSGIGEGHFAVGQGATRANFMHEYGHNVYAHMPDVHSKKWKAIMRDIEISDLNSSISRYASSHEAEAFAEAFSAYTHAAYGLKGKRLPYEIEKFFAEMFKKEPPIKLGPKPPPVKKRLPTKTKLHYSDKQMKEFEKLAGKGDVQAEIISKEFAAYGNRITKKEAEEIADALRGYMGKDHDKWKAVQDGAKGIRGAAAIEKKLALIDKYIKHAPPIPGGKTELYSTFSRASLKEFSVGQPIRNPIFNRYFDSVDGAMGVRKMDNTKDALIKIVGSGFRGGASVKHWGKEGYNVLVGNVKVFKMVKKEMVSVPGLKGKFLQVTIQAYK